MKFKILFMVLFALSFSAFGQNNEQEELLAPDSYEEPTQSGWFSPRKNPLKALEPLDFSIGKTSPYFLSAAWAPLDLVLSNKIGFSFGKYRDSKSSWEIEYIFSSSGKPMIIEDLGEIKEQRLSLTTRSFLNSRTFNFAYGIAFNSNSLKLNDGILDRVSGVNTESIDTINTQSLGFCLGIGNRWKINNNMVISLDWGTWTQPLFVTKNENPYLNEATNNDDKSKIKTAQKLLGYFPRLSVVKMQIGLLF